MDDDNKHTMKVKWNFKNTPSASSKRKTKETKYRNFSVVKMGCNKCTEVFYREGGYNDHLFRKHKIKNVSKYPPTILNTIWQRHPELPQRKESEAMKHSCPKCGTKFYESSALETHEYFCYKLSAKDEEARAKSLYEHVVHYDTQKKLDKIDDKKTDRGRSKKRKKEEQMTIRNLTTSKKSPKKREKAPIKKPTNMKPKEFTNKPVMKKYPLCSNKEVEDAEKLPAKYQTKNKKEAKSTENVESFTELSGSLEEFDDTKNDSNYDPHNSTSGSSEQFKEKELKLPTITRPKQDL